MIPTVHWVVAGALDQVTGGYLYDRAIVEGLLALGVEVRVVELTGRHPLADDRARASARAGLSGLDDGACVVIDGLALPATAPVLYAQARRLRVVALVHHPLFLETGLSQAEAARLREEELACLALSARVVCTSPFTAGVLRDLGVPHGRIGTVVPGTVPPAQSAACSASRSGVAAPHLLCVATVTARKGHVVLVRALAGLADLDWRLTCVGSLTREPETVAAVRAAVSSHGLDDRIEFAGERPPGSLDALFEDADLFVLPSFYEGYGMALAEALAHGLPVVSTRAGAIASTVPADAGILVPPGDPAALADALRRVLSDGALRRSMRDAAARAAAALPGWPRQADRFLQELRCAA